MDCILSLLIQKLHHQIANSTYMKEDSPPWNTIRGLAKEWLATGD